MKAVEYRDIVGFPGYRVGSDGSVWSRRTHAGVLGETWKRRRPNAVDGGHLRVDLWPGQKRIHVHRLVLEAFVGPCPAGMEACHFPDRDPANNKLCNLRWDTRKNNYADSVKHGSNTKGQRHGCARITDATAKEIKRLLAAGSKGRQIARQFGVTENIVSRIKTKRNWSHVGE